MYLGDWAWSLPAVLAAVAVALNPITDENSVESAKNYGLHI
jgi:hypothetical protein